MKKDQIHNPIIPSLYRLINARLQLANLLYTIIFFGFGLCFGIIITFHLKNVSFYLQFTKFSLSTDTHINITHEIPFSTPPPTQKIRLDTFIHPKNIMHDLTDQELIWKASMVPKVVNYPYVRTPKVAFMFLTRGSVLLSPLWEMFFKGHNGLFNIYVHSSSTNWTENNEDSVFYGRRIPSKVRNFIYV